jgi:hypothetical protein
LPLSHSLDYIMLYIVKLRYCETEDHNQYNFSIEYLNTGVSSSIPSPKIVAPTRKGMDRLAHEVVENMWGKHKQIFQ